MANPRIGTKRADGKVYAGQNYGYQTPASFNRLKDDGKFRAGTQALDRVSSSVSRVVRQHAPGVAQHFDNIKADQQRQAARQDKQIRQTVGNRIANAAQNDATGKVLDQASKATNVDRRIVGAAATAAQAAIGKAALKGSTKTLPAPKSVGAAARADVASRTAPATRRLPTSARPNGTVRAAGLQPTTPPKPSITPAQRQRLSKGLEGAGTRQGNNIGTTKVNVQNGSGRGPNGARVFTPTNRAKAAQRSNARQARGNGFTLDDGSNHRYISTGGLSSKSTRTGRIDELASRAPRSRPAGGPFEGKRAAANNDIAFKPSYGGFESASERGRAVKRSKLYNKTRTANIEDQLGHQINDRTRVGDHVTATPVNDINKRTGELKSTSARARYYQGKSNKALSSTTWNDENGLTRYEVNARRGPNNKWTNPANSKDVGKGRKVQRDIQWDPNDLHKPLADLAKDTPRTLLGRRAGGNSNVKAKVTPKKPAPKSVGAAKPGTTQKTTRRLTRPADKVQPNPNVIASRGRPAYRTPNVITGRVGRRIREVLDAHRAGRTPAPVSSTTTTRFAEGTRRNDRVAPPRSRTTRPTKTEQVRTIKSGLRDRGQAYVEANTPRSSRTTANQARGPASSVNRGGGTMTSYGETNARRTESIRTNTTTQRRGGVRNNSQDAGRQAVDRFEGRARTIVNDRIRREGENMTSRERQALTRSLQRQMRQGSNRVRAAAESQSTRSQNETRSNTRNFTGTGRQAYQEPNRLDRRGRSEAQYRARAGRVRTSRISTTTTPNRVNTANTPNSERVSPAVIMRRRRAAQSNR